MAKRIELSKEQEEWIYSELQTKTYKQIAPELKEVYGIEIRYDSLRHYMERHGYRSPRNGRFSKGHISPRSGKPRTFRSEKAKENSEANQFQTGNTPQTWVPIGTQSGPDKNGYYRIKVSDDKNVPSRKNWKFKHRVIYEETYGPIPEGHYVVFLDGNRENFDPKNLMAVPGGAKSYFNRKFGYTGNAEANKANWLLATLEYKAKKKEKKE